MAPKKTETKETKKEEVKKVEQPDKKKYQDEMQAISDKIDALQLKQKAIQAQMSEKSADKDEFFQKKAELKAHISTYQEQCTKIQAQLSQLYDQQKNKANEKKSVAQELRKTQNELTCKTEEEVDKRIAQIELEMSTTTMPLQMEKRKIQEIAVLKKSKPAIVAANKKVENLEGRQKELEASSNVDVEGQIAIFKKQLEEYRDEKKKYFDERTALEAAWNDKTGGNSELDVQRKEIQAQVRELVEQKNAKRQELKDAENAYYQSVREQRALVQKQRDAERDAQRAEREAARLKTEFEQLEIQPHLAETTALEQAITFLKSLLPKEEKENVNEQKKDYNNPEGSVVLTNKKDREEEFFTATKKKGLKQKNKGNKNTGIKHNSETLCIFDALSMTAPMNLGQVPETLEKLEAKYDEYMKAVAIWKQKLEDGSLVEEFKAEQEKKKADAAEKENEAVGSAEAQAEE